MHNAGNWKNDSTSPRLDRKIRRVPPMTTTHAPVALFAYNRPEHLKRALSALGANPEAGTTELHVFSDAAKDTASEDKVAQVRNIIAKATGFASITQILR